MSDFAESVSLFDVEVERSLLRALTPVDCHTAMPVATGEREREREREKDDYVKFRAGVCNYENI